MISYSNIGILTSLKYWSNTFDNYLLRTDKWEKYPNGRWGDSSNSDFGDISDYHLFTLNLGSKKQKLKMWRNKIENLALN